MRFKFSLLLIIFLLAFGFAYSEELNLDQALQMALQNNPQVAERQSEYQSKLAAVGIYTGENGLKAGLNGYSGVRDMSGVVSSAPDSVPSLALFPNSGVQAAQLAVMMPLYTGGKLQARIAAARSQAEVSRFSLLQAENEVAFTVRDKFYQVLRQAEQVKVYQRLVDKEDEQLRVSKKLYQNGKIPLMYHLRAKNELARAQQELNNQNSELAMAISELKTVLGKNQDYDLQVKGDLTALEYQPATESFELAKKQRPELKELDNQLQAASQEVAEAKSQYAPQLYLMGMYEYKSDQDKGYMVNGVASLPLLDAGSRKAEVEEKLQNLRAIEAQKKETELKIEEDVHHAMEELNASRLNLPLSEAAVTEALEIYRIAKLRYEGGKGIYLELLDALWNLSTAELSRAEAIYRNNLAVSRLMLALGEK